jgi:hypothetical protein
MMRKLARRTKLRQLRRARGQDWMTFGEWLRRFGA